MNIFKKFSNHILPATVLFLLAFIPLYPKLPLVDIRNTWVYIRVEDFLVVVVLALWGYLFVKKQVNLRTPLTIPILIFWLAGALATIHGVIIIFPTISNVFPNVALLAFLRHIEYLSVFFIAYSAVQSKKFVIASIWTVLVTLILVSLYGFGQRYLSFPAYLTMNEEYAKGIPIIISPLNRISSTFAGHYDLAAYLVLIIPILVSLAFGFRNLFLKLLFLVSSLLGFVLLFMTVSRVSFFVLFVALGFVLLFHKKKVFLAFVPIVAIFGIIFLFSQSSLLARFGNTVKQIDVLVDAKSGAPIGHVNFQPRSYIFDKSIIESPEESKEEQLLTSREISQAKKEGVPDHLIKYRLPREVAIVAAKITSTGETLPQGSAYINLSLSPVIQRLGGFLYEYPPTEASPTASIKIMPGDYLVKRASAYDLSFTTRFQGEWPNALLAFGRNVFLGSGYGSVSLAVDNNYYRMLGETGLLGTLAFIAIFVVFGVYAKKVLPSVESPVIRSFILGFSAGVIGLSLNAVLIDVFEASKVAFQLWLLMGIAVGALSLYASKKFNAYKELLSALTSPYAVVIYFLFLTIAIFSNTVTGYFAGDDFTWFRWATDPMKPSTLVNYFTNAEGFFYRPGTKTYFLVMYSVFWLNQIAYHVVSIGLHFIVSVLMYLLARKIFRNNLYASITGFVFLIASGYLEIVLWASATGHLFNAVFILISLLLFIMWHEKKHNILLILSILSGTFSLLFYELGIVVPLLAGLYLFYSKEDLNLKSLVAVIKSKALWALFIPNILYFGVRLFSQAHWSGGDYSYNLLKLPLNAVGNAVGYVMISLLGPLSYPVYEKIRLATKTNIPLALITILVFVAVIVLFVRVIWPKIAKYEKRIIIFSFCFFIICLIPFLGLGNITYRYSYLASFGVFMVFALLIGKTFSYLKDSGRDVAFAATGVLMTVFFLVHIIQAQQVMIEWDGAGVKVERFLNSLDSLYSDSWRDRKEGVDLYFTNVPIKNGNAWVFPVGLSDAVWFAFRSDVVRVHTIPTLKEVPASVYMQPYSSVFEFRDDGSLKKMSMDRMGNIIEDE